MHAMRLKGEIDITKEDASVLLFIFLLLPHMKPPYFELFPVLDGFFNGWRIVSFLIALLVAVFVKRKLSPLAIALLALCAYLIGNTAIKGANVYVCFTQVFPIAAVTLIYEAFSDKMWTIVKAQMCCFEMLLYINLFTILCFPEGMYEGDFTYFTKNYFLGYYNNQSKYFFPALVISMLYVHKTGKKIRAYMLIGVIFLSALLTWSGAILAALFTMVLVYFVGRNKVKVFNYYNYWLLQIIFMGGVIFLRLERYLQWIIDDMLGKWDSLSVRLRLWSWTMGRITDSVWTGYGVYSSQERAALYGQRWAAHAHNLILELLFEGGMIYLVAMILIIIVAGKRLYKYRHTYCVKVISLGFLGWSIQSMVEPFVSPFLMGMFMLAYYCGELVEPGLNESEVKGREDGRGERYLKSLGIGRGGAGMMPKAPR